MPRTEQLSIYLLKTNIVTWQDAVHNNAQYTELELPAGLLENGVCLGRPTVPRPPNWLNYFPQATRTAAIALRSASAGIVLFFQAKGRWFAVCFGTGWHLLKKDSFVRGFGLRSALSLVKGDTLKAVDVSTYDNLAKHRRVSTSKGTTIDSFDIEGQLDLLKGVVGECAQSSIGKQIGGRDSAVVWTKVDISRLPKLCSILLRAFQSNRVSKRYPIVNNVTEIRDPSEETRLDLLLDAILANDPNHEIHLAPPEAVDWQNVAVLAIDHADAPPESVSFTMGDIRTMYLPETPSCAVMKGVNVSTVTPNGTPGAQAWTLYDCLVTEIGDPLDPNVKCILMAGQWYTVATSFVAEVNLGLATIRIHATALPDAQPNEKEGEYNLRFAGLDAQNRALLDKQNISYGGGNSKIEVCDVLSNAPCLYHVKDYSGSATLSHLFAQGTVSSRLLLEQDFRQELIDKNPGLTATVFQVPTINASNFEIVYAIICDPQKNLPIDLPFFSKVRLLESTRELRRMGFTNTSVAKITRQ